MDESGVVRILLVEDNRDFAHLVEVFLRKYEQGRFAITWRENGPDAFREFEEGGVFDLILMDYFLPGQNGLEITRALRDRGIAIPVVFLTANKDFDLAVEVMKLGIEDYLVKDEISTPVLPKTILSVIERKALRDRLTTLEISQKRLEAIQEIVRQIAQEVRLPLDRLKKETEELAAMHRSDSLNPYLTIIRDNLDRIEKKIVQLKDLKTDKTITYIKNIRMFDLSGP